VGLNIRTCIHDDDDDDDDDDDVLYESGPLACSDSELTSETMNPFRHLGRTLWTLDRSIAEPLTTEHSTKQRAWT
jgi:hypothetical protein